MKQLTEKPRSEITTICSKMTCSEMNGNPNLYTHQPHEVLHSYAVISSHPGQNRRDILGHDAGLVDVCYQFLAGGRVIGSLLIHRERHTETLLKL